MIPPKGRQKTDQPTPRDSSAGERRLNAQRLKALEHDSACWTNWIPKKQRTINSCDCPAKEEYQKLFELSR